MTNENKARASREANELISMKYAGRNLRMCQMRREGKKLMAVADYAGLSPSRASRITERGEVYWEGLLARATAEGYEQIGVTAKQVAASAKMSAAQLQDTSADKPQTTVTLSGHIKHSKKDLESSFEFNMELGEEFMVCDIADGEHVFFNSAGGGIMCLRCSHTIEIVMR